MTLSCADATVALGAYVIGSLEPAERADLEAHLAMCPACRDELAELAPLPGLLSRLSVEEALTGPPPVDDAMLERLLAAAQRERRRVARGRWLAAAAAVVVLVAGTAGGVAGWRATHATSWTSYAASSGRVHLSVKLASAQSGTRLEMSMRGVAKDERCSLVVVARDGRTEVAGWWEATYSGTAHINGTTSIPRSQVAQLRVVTDTGERLVTLNV
jgi:putative zinc finger protein